MTDGNRTIGRPAHQAKPLVPGWRAIKRGGMDLTGTAQ
jgi:hypothetical protein